MRILITRISYRIRAAQVAYACVDVLHARSPGSSSNIVHVSLMRTRTREMHMLPCAGSHLELRILASDRPHAYAHRHSMRKVSHFVLGVFRHDSLSLCVL